MCQNKKYRRKTNLGDLIGHEVQHPFQDNRTVVVYNQVDPSTVPEWMLEMIDVDDSVSEQVQNHWRNKEYKKE